jgi:hypothetical protein
VDGDGPGRSGCQNVRPFARTLQEPLTQSLLSSTVSCARHQLCLPTSQPGQVQGAAHPHEGLQRDWEESSCHWRWVVWLKDITNEISQVASWAIKSPSCSLHGHLIPHPEAGGLSTLMPLLQPVFSSTIGYVNRWPGFAG